MTKKDTSGFDIIVYDEDSEINETSYDGKRNLFKSANRIINKTTSRAIDFKVFSDNLTSFSNAFSSMLENTKSEMSNYELNEVEVSISVNSKGKISVIASAELGASATIKLKFKKSVQ